MDISIRKLHDQNIGHLVINQRWKKPPEYCTLNNKFRLIRKKQIHTDNNICKSNYKCLNNYHTNYETYSISWQGFDRE